MRRIRLPMHDGFEAAVTAVTAVATFPYEVLVCSDWDKPGRELSEELHEVDGELFAVTVVGGELEFSSVELNDILLQGLSGPSNTITSRKTSIELDVSRQVTQGRELGVNDGMITLGKSPVPRR